MSVLLLTCANYDTYNNGQIITCTVTSISESIMLVVGLYMPPNMHAFHKLF